MTKKKVDEIMNKDTTSVRSRAYPFASRILAVIPRFFKALLRWRVFFSVLLSSTKSSRLSVSI